MNVCLETLSHWLSFGFNAFLRSLNAVFFNLEASVFSAINKDTGLYNLSFLMIPPRFSPF